MVMQFIIRYTVCRRVPIKSTVRAVELWYVCSRIRFITHFWQSVLTNPVFSVSLPFVWNIAMSQPKVNWKFSDSPASVSFRKQEGFPVNSSLDRDWQIQHIIHSHMICIARLCRCGTLRCLSEQTIVWYRNISLRLYGEAHSISLSRMAVVCSFFRNDSLVTYAIFVSRKHFAFSIHGRYGKNKFFFIFFAYSSIQMETIHSTFRYTKSKHTYDSYLTPVDV